MPSSFAFNLFLYQLDRKVKKPFPADTMPNPWSILGFHCHAMKYKNQNQLMKEAKNL